ncbi:CPBP family intramembrane glutamic endopeptidase [Austwickia chelonae]|uniref:CPBP family intramembrane glutamic endopeptidase n=1 Tax=Austwickia chelonae TaxID=100225 RepID=UPI0013C30135|nr:CPBP family intramembrane glutamic endopeptidase [Austwickia chelonae]
MKASPPRKQYLKYLKHIFIYLLVYLAMTGAMEIIIGNHVVGQLFGARPKSSEVYDNAMNQLGDFAANVLTALALIYTYRRLNPAEERGPGLPGFVRHRRDLIVGLVAGAVSMIIVVGTMVVIGVATINVITPRLTSLTMLIYLLSVAYEEEVFVRGTLQHTLAKIVPLVFVILLPSVLFGLIHLPNPNITVFAVINIILVGVFFAVVTWITKNLYLAIGFHITWNWFQASFFGLPTSGATFDGDFFFKVTVDEGSDFLTGGVFGPEASILTTVAFLVMTAGAWVIHRRRERPVGRIAGQPAHRSVD